MNATDNTDNVIPMPAAPVTTATLEVRTLEAAQAIFDGAPVSATIDSLAEAFERASIGRDDLQYAVHLLLRAIQAANGQ